MKRFFKLNSEIIIDIEMIAFVMKPYQDNCYKVVLTNEDAFHLFDDDYEKLKEILIGEK